MFIKFREKYFREWGDNHEIHKNIIPRKFGNLKTTLCMCGGGGGGGGGTDNYTYTVIYCISTRLLLAH